MELAIISLMVIGLEPLKQTVKRLEAIYRVNSAIQIQSKLKLVSCIAFSLFFLSYLSIEYYFDECTALYVSADEVALFESVVVAVSVVGFLLYALFSKYPFSSRVLLCVGICAVVSLVGVTFSAVFGQSLIGVLLFGVATFLFLGVLGGAAHYLLARLFALSSNLARVVGLFYALGIGLQFLLHAFTLSALLQTGIFCVIVLVLSCMLFKANQPNGCLYFRISNSSSTGENDKIIENAYAKEVSRVISDSDSVLRKKALKLIFATVLLTAVYATLNVLLTAHHAAGDFDLGAGGRLFLIGGAVAAGFLFDSKARSNMNLYMVCIAILSGFALFATVFEAPLWLIAIVFYLGSGSFVVFFSVRFIELSCEMKTQALWAGMGRVVNNGAGLVLAPIVLSFVSYNNALFVVAFSLAILVGIVLLLREDYQKPPIYEEQEEASIKCSLSDVCSSEQSFLRLEERIDLFSRAWKLTERECEVLQILVSSDAAVQDIAKQLYLSRTALYRHIASINEKTETNSRMGIVQFFYSWEPSELKSELKQGKNNSNT